jgi:hypothetical protein
MKKAINSIQETLKELKIKQGQIDNKGYTKMLWESGKLGKNKFIK